MWNSVEDYAVSFIFNPGPFYIIGRITVTLFSVGTILVIYRLCIRHFNIRTGLLSALLLALCYGHIVGSQDVKADIPASFFTILSMYFILNFIETCKIKHLVIAIISAGAGTATKFYPYVMLVPIYISIFYVYGYPLENLQSNWKKIIAITIGTILIFYATFFVCSPYNFIDPLGFKSTFGKIIKLLNTINEFLVGSATNTEYNFINSPLSRGAAFLNYIQTLIKIEGMGPIIGIITICGFILMLFSRSVKFYIFLSFPILFIFVSIFVFPGYAEPRHQLPVYAFLVICGGYLLNYIYDRYSKQWIIVIFLSFLIYPTTLIIDRGIYISKTDTRNVAKFWIEENIPNKTKIVVDEYGPVLHKSEQQLNMELSIARNADKEGQFTAHYAKYLNYQLHASQLAKTSYIISEIRFPWWREKEPKNGKYVLTEADRDMGNPLRPIGVRPLEWYEENGYQYFIVNSIRYNPFFNPNTDRYNNFPKFRNFYHSLFRKGTLVKEFSPETDNRPGPTIRIYLLRNTPVHGASSYDKQ